MPRERHNCPDCGWPMAEERHAPHKRIPADNPYTYDPGGLVHELADVAHVHRICYAEDRHHEEVEEA